MEYQGAALKSGSLLPWETPALLLILGWGEAVVPASPSLPQAPPTFPSPLSLPQPPPAPSDSPSLPQPPQPPSAPSASPSLPQPSLAFPSPLSLPQPPSASPSLPQPPPATSSLPQLPQPPTASLMALADFPGWGNMSANGTVLPSLPPGRPSVSCFLVCSLRAKGHVRVDVDGGAFACFWFY